MSWLRIEGRMPNHTKVTSIGDAAFRLHVTAMAWSVEELSDGKVPAHVPATLPRAPRGKAALDKVLRELTDAALWERQEDGSYVIHDFLKYNPSAAQSKALREAKVAAGASGGRAKAVNGHGKSLAAARQSANDAPVAAATDISSSRAGAGARSDSDSETDSHRDPLPPPETGQSQPSLAERAKSWLKQADLGDGKGRWEADLNFGDPTKWPETLGVSNIFASIYQRRDDPRHSGDPRCRVIVERFAEGYSPEDLFEAIGGSAHDPNISDNRQFQTLRTILRDAAQVDKFRALVAPPPTAAQNADDAARMAKALAADNARREAELRATVASYARGDQ